MAFLRANPDIRRDIRVARSVGLSPAQFDRLPENDQTLLIAEDHLDLTKCPDCGGDPEVCGDADRDWYPQRVVCHRTANQRAAARKYEELHAELPFHDGGFSGWSKTWGPGTPFRFDDGVTVYVSEVDEHPDDDFLTASSTRDRDNPSADSSNDLGDRERG